MSMKKMHDVPSGEEHEVGESDNNQQVNFYIEEGDGMMGENAKSIDELGLKKGRKRRSNPEEWKNSKRKYTKGAEGRELKDPFKCRRKCFEKVAADTRQRIMEEYYDMKNIDRQRDFHIRSIIKKLKQRTRVRPKDGDDNNNDSKRMYTLVYQLNEIDVCKVTRSTRLTYLSRWSVLRLIRRGW